MMVVVVLLSTIELGWIIIRDIVTAPVILLEIDELLEIFGFFLLVLIGIELHPEAGPANKFAKMLKDEGLLCKDTVGQVLRLAPPLVIEQKDLDWAFERVAKVLG